jgi:hypothetical protein
MAGRNPDPAHGTFTAYTRDRCPLPGMSGLPQTQDMILRRGGISLPLSCGNPHADVRGGSASVSDSPGQAGVWGSLLHGGHIQIAVHCRQYHVR